jgi:EAL domain-containing protein (putative c-di-GMP-specific phosphodiesterase class I)
MVDIHSRRIVGSEALVRWKHPTRGLLPPASFISVTEESGLIVPIGQWVLDAALAEARLWADQTGADRFVQSVNLSARQLSNPDLVDQVAAALQRHDWPADWLCLELTESVLLDDLEVTLEALVRLRGLGVRLAIDDFGTGYSSLTYLQRFPVDAVKIDRSFVSGLTTGPNADARSDATIPRAVVVMAHALGLSATAEGVETEEQLAVLQELGCDYAQGYLFSSPVTSEALSLLLRRPGRRLG